MGKSPHDGSAAVQRSKGQIPKVCQNMIIFTWRWYLYPIWSMGLAYLPTDINPKCPMGLEYLPIYIYHKYKTNVGTYSIYIHGASGKYHWKEVDLNTDKKSSFISTLSWWCSRKTTPRDIFTYSKSCIMGGFIVQTTILDLLVWWLEKITNIFPKWWFCMVMNTMVESVKITV